MPICNLQTILHGNFSDALSCFLNNMNEPIFHSFVDSKSIEFDWVVRPTFQFMQMCFGFLLFHTQVMIRAGKTFPHISISLVVSI